MSVGITVGDRTLNFCFGNNEAAHSAQFHFWEYINGNQTFILDSILFGFYSILFYSNRILFYSVLPFSKPAH
jgi:hypothetical protein